MKNGNDPYIAKTDIRNSTSIPLVGMDFAGDQQLSDETIARIASDMIEIDLFETLDESPEIDIVNSYLPRRHIGWLTMKISEIIQRNIESTTPIINVSLLRLGSQSILADVNLGIEFRIRPEIKNNSVLPTLLPTLPPTLPPTLLPSSTDLWFKDERGIPRHISQFIGIQTTTSHGIESGDRDFVSASRGIQIIDMPNDVIQSMKFLIERHGSGSRLEQAIFAVSLGRQ